MCEELGLEKDDFKVHGHLDSFIAPLGAIIEPFVGELKSNVLNKIKIDKNEVDKVFTIPLKFFLENKPELYKARIEIHAEYNDKNGENKVLLPGEELGLSKKYHKAWGGNIHKVYVYQTEYGVLWGITATILQDVLKRIK